MVITNDQHPWFGLWSPKVSKGAAATWALGSHTFHMDMCTEQAYHEKKHVKNKYFPTYHVHTAVTSDKTCLLEVLQVTDFFRKKIRDTLI